MLVERLVVGALQTNCYIVSDEEGNACVIDPGGDAEQIEEYVSRHDLKLSKILLTHGHPDHNFAAGKLQQDYDLELVMHRADVDQISGGLEIASIFYDMREYIPPKPTQFIADDVVNVGSVELKVIHTPGHTPGGVCFLHDSIMFSGDTLFASSIGRTDLPGGNFSELMDSIKNKLFVLKESIQVYPGHGGETSIGSEKCYNPFIE